MILSEGWDIELIKKLRSSLTAKIFLLLALMLTVCCIATYAFIAWLIPKTYPSHIDMNSVEAFAEHIIEEFQNTDSKELEIMATGIQDAARTQYGEDLELYLFNSSGEKVYGSETIQTHQKLEHIANRTEIYPFTSEGSPEEYCFFFIDGTQAVNQALEAITQAFPYLCITIFIISILAAFICSKYITMPILKISKASQNMMELDFSKQEKSKRTDELGTVYNNLSSLAHKLSLTLDELENANEQLKKDIDKERLLERQRTEFFSAVSHELKTPITIAKGQLQGMICEVGRYKDRNTYLVKSLEVINDLETMVQELLTVSRMDVSGYVCRRDPFDLSLQIKQCLTAQEDIFIQKDMRVSSDLQENIIYHGDQQLLKQVFDNLICNALNYSPTGNQIHIFLKLKSDKIIFFIENTGVHIETEELPRLFEAFYRPDQSHNRQTGGSGLGLYIVKKILDMHNAHYSLENSKNGVVFHIEF